MITRFYTGCVNTLRFSDDGRSLLSGSDDCCVILWNVDTYQCQEKIKTAHEDNIFSAMFAPHSDQTRVISSCGAGALRITSIEKPAISTSLLQVEGLVVKTDMCLNNTCVLAATTSNGAVIVDPRTPQVVWKDIQLGPRKVFALPSELQLQSLNCFYPPLVSLSLSPPLLFALLMILYNRSPQGHRGAARSLE